MKPNIVIAEIETIENFFLINFLIIAYWLNLYFKVGQGTLKVKFYAKIDKSSPNNLDLFLQTFRPFIVI